MTSSIFNLWSSNALALDVLSAAQGTPDGVRRRQSRRLHALLEAARRAPLYRQRLGRHGAAPPKLQDVEPVTKRELMRRFDEWVVDPVLHIDGLRRFVKNPTAIGDAFAGRYTVWESSGTTGLPAIFVQDEHAMAVYGALEALRRPAAAGWRAWMDPWYLSDRFAFVGATGGHFASTVSVQRLRRTNPGLARRLKSFSFLQPIASLVDELNRFSPTILATYPTAAVMLAEEVDAGRLGVRLREVWTGGEALTPGMRRMVERSFCCPVNNSYGASEFLALAAPCRHGALHLNSDWAILETVDERMRPVPPGERGCTTLLTNLANHVQPILRYNIGDDVVIRPGPCPCGSPLPAIEVQGRVDEMLVLRGENGRAVRLLPLALTTVLEDDAGVFDFQIVQDGERALRLSVAGDAPEAAATRACEALRAFLHRQGLTEVHIDTRCCPECARGRSGKAQRVVAARVTEAATA